MAIHKSLLPFDGTRRWGGQNTKFSFTHFPGPVFILMLKGNANVRHKCMDFVSGA